MFLPKDDSKQHGSSFKYDANNNKKRKKKDLLKGLFKFGKSKKEVNSQAVVDTCTEENKLNSLHEETDKEKSSLVTGRHEK